MENEKIKTKQKGKIMDMDKKSIMTIRLPEWVKKELRKMAYETQVSQNNLIVNAVIYMINKIKKENKNE